MFNIRNATSADCFSINDLVRFAGPAGPEAIPQIQVAKQFLVSKPCLGLVIVGEHTDEQIQEFFQPNPEEVIHKVPVGWRMPHVMKMLGCFESVSQASKNGWNQDILFGFSEKQVKHSKVKGVIFILNLHVDFPGESVKV
jgi:hypothetical protein